MTTSSDSAPDPEALAAAEEWARAFLNVTGWRRDNTHIAHLLAEYDRRGVELRNLRRFGRAMAAEIEEMKAESYEYDRRGRVEAAARALMEGWGGRPRVERDERWCSPQLDQRLDALARELGGGAAAEAFMREVHGMYPAGQLDAYVAEYDRRGAKLAEVHKEVVDKPGSTHAEVMSTLKWLWERDDELGWMKPQWENRHEIIQTVADAAGHTDEFPGRGLAEHVGRLARVEAAARAYIDECESPASDQNEVGRLFGVLREALREGM